MKNKIAIFETLDNFPFEPLHSNNSNNAIHNGLFEFTQKISRKKLKAKSLKKVQNPENYKTDS
jgi:hypothetical protein